jgi:hypothetical protein
VARVTQIATLGKPGDKMWHADRPPLLGPAQNIELRRLLAHHEAAGAPSTVLLQAALHAGVLPQVAAAVLRSPTPAPPHVAQLARDALAAQNEIDLLLEADLNASIVALAAARVTPVLLKGAALRVLGLVDRGERHTHDIDLLVAPEAVPAAIAALRDAGFELRPAPAGVGVDGRDLASSRWADLHAAADLVGPHGTPLDLHHSLPGHTWATSAVWIRNDTVDTHVAGCVVRVPTRDALAVQLSAHVLLHHRSDPRLLLRHVTDSLRLGDSAWWRDLAGRVASTDRVHVRMTAALVDLMLGEFSPTDPRSLLQRLLFAPGGPWRDTVDVVWQAVESVDALRYDAIHRPAMLGWRVLPHPRYMREHDGVEGGALALTAGWIRRLARLPLRPLFGERSP